MAADAKANANAMERLLAIMAALRHPETGCPWDLEQDFRSIAPYTIEEAFEVAEAIERGDMEDLKNELGDLLLQVVFHARMAEEDGHFAFADVAHAISDKMERRHPHVFGDEEARTAGAVRGRWEEIKRQEKAAKNKPQSVLDEVPAALPALMRAVKLQARAAALGFDWPETEAVLDKLAEETAELLEEARAGSTKTRVEDEFGDLLFVLANLARHLEIDPEAALRRTNEKFRRRFLHVEARIAESGRRTDDWTLEEMDEAWNEAKLKERR